MSPEEQNFIDNLNLFDKLPNGSYVAEFPKKEEDGNSSKMDLNASREFAEHVRKIAPSLDVDDRNGRVIMTLPIKVEVEEEVPF